MSLYTEFLMTIHSIMERCICNIVLLNAALFSMTCKCWGLRVGLKSMNVMSTPIGSSPVVHNMNECAMYV